MNDITYAVSVDVNNPIIPYNVYIASVLDSNVRYLEITLYQNGNVIALSNEATATASLVTDNVLVDGSVNCAISDNIISVPLEDLQRHGNLDVQVTVTEGEKVLAIPFPIQVRVTPNIAENAQIGENSLGSYAEVVREITAARGDYPNLKDRLDGEIDRIDDDISDINTVLLGKANKAAAGSAGELAALDGNGSPIRSGVSVIQSIGEGSNSRVPTTAAVKNALDGKAGNTNKDLSFFIGASDVLEGVTFEQGSITYITRWSDYSLNENSTRIRAFIDLNNLSGITIVPCNGYGFIYAVFDANHNLLSDSTSYIDENRTLTFSATATNLRIVIHKVGNGNISPSEAVNIKVYDRDYTLKRIGDTAKSASEAVASKANAATTLAGYGITDAYTKAEAGSRFFAKAAIGFIDGTNYSAPAPILEFNTTTGNVTVNKCFLLGANGTRYQISSAQTIAYDKGSGVATQTLVYDTSDNTVKVFYTSPNPTNADDSKHIILAYYHRIRIVNGIIFTNLSYSIDGKYIGNMPKDISPSFPDGQIVKLKVCAYNVGEYSYGSKPAVSAETAAEIIGKYRSFYSKENCDILGLCENRQVLKSVLPNGLSTDPKTAEEIYDYLYPIKYGFYDSMWAFTRYGISGTSSSRFNTTDRGAGDAEYIKGNLSINGLNVFFMVVHLSPNSLATRLAQYEELIAMLNQHDYFICFGDFNAKGGTVDGVTYTAQDEFNILLEEGYHIANGGYMGLMTTFKGPSGTDDQKLDNIVTSDNIIIANSYVPDVYDSLTSDHVPLIAELVIR